MTITATAPAPAASQAAPASSSAQASGNPAGGFAPSSDSSSGLPAGDGAGSDLGDSSGSESGTAGTATTQPAKPDLRTLLKKGEEDPNYLYSDEEMAELQPYLDSKKPIDAYLKDKGEVAEPAPGENPDNAAKAAAAPDFLQDTMKKIGASKPEEIPEKVAGLLARLHGKEAPKIKELETLISKEKGLWADVRQGVPAAIEYIKSNYGVVPLSAAAQPPAAAQQQAGPSGEPAKGEEVFLDASKAIDSDAASEVNKVFVAQSKRMTDMEKKLQTALDRLEGDRMETMRARATETAKRDIVDELVQVSANFPELKGVSRQEISDWFGGKENPKMAVLDQLFTVSGEFAQRGPDGKVLRAPSLSEAYYIWKGRNADRLIAEAKKSGLKQAYERQPDRTASGLSGSATTGQYKQFTDADFQKMADPENGWMHIPDDFMTDGKPDQRKIPREGWKYFGFKA